MGRDAFLVQLTVKSRNVGPGMGVSAGRTLAKITFNPYGRNVVNCFVFYIFQSLGF